MCHTNAVNSIKDKGSVYKWTQLLNRSKSTEDMLDPVDSPFEMVCLFLSFSLFVSLSLADLRGEYSPLVAECSGVMAKLVWARNQPMVSRYIVACLNRMSC